MSKVRTICMQADVPKAIDALYKFGLIHMARTRLGTPGSPLPSFAAVSEHLIELRAVEKALGIKEAALEGELPPLAEVLGRSQAVRADYAELLAAREQLAAFSSDSFGLASRLKLVAPLADAGLSPQALHKSSSVSLHYFEVTGPRAQFDSALAGLSAQAVHSMGHCLVAIDPAQSQELGARLSKIARAVPVPPSDEPTFALDAEITRAKLSGIEAGIAELRSRQAALLSQVEAAAGAVRAQLEEHAKLSSLPNKFGRTESIEVIEGFVATKSLPILKDALYAATEGRVEFEVFHEPGDAPVILDNPPLIRRFEFLVRFFSLPGRGEYDPTLFIAVTFPIIFGMILGDIAYGILAMLLAAFLYRGAKAGFIKALSGMMFLSGLMTSAWGLVYGEFLGSDVMLGIRLHPIIERGGEGVITLMVAAIFVGLIHLGFGLLVGFYTNWKHGHKGHAYAKLCWLLLEAGFLLLGINIFAPAMFGNTTATVAILLVAVAGLGKFEGAKGLVEIPGLISNILSYLRIMALGLSGVILSKLVNIIPVGSAFSDLASSAARGDAAGIVMSLVPFVLFAIVFTLGHAVALGLGLFESGIQSLRLHYVEFFSKFYHGGGAAFVPLRDARE